MKAFNNTILLFYCVLIALAYSCGDHSAKEGNKHHKDNTTSARDSSGSTVITPDTTLIAR